MEKEGEASGDGVLQVRLLHCRDTTDAGELFPDFLYHVAGLIATRAQD